MHTNYVYQLCNPFSFQFLKRRIENLFSAVLNYHFKKTRLGQAKLFQIFEASEKWHAVKKWAYLYSMAHTVWAIAYSIGILIREKLIQQRNIFQILASESEVLTYM